MPGSDRAALFAESASRSGLPVTIIEKDFWVCWMLERLWASPFAPGLIFKGGTSLSKCFGLIQRFSEDIDIGLDRAVFAVDDPAEPNISSSQRNRRVEALKAAARHWIETTFRDGLSEIIRADLGGEGEKSWNWQIEYDTDGMPKLRWNPPPSNFKRRRTTDRLDPYLTRSVLIEAGARAAHWPASFHEVTPYVAQHIPEAFQSSCASVCTLEVGRTFWEKATILHVLHHETRLDLEAGKPTKERERFSRHCYDLHCIARSEAGGAAARDFELLADVAEFKRVFFCSSRVKEAQYEDARLGTLRLAPHPELAGFFARDYARMNKSGFFFGTPPTWTEIVQTLQSIESRINEV